MILRSQNPFGKHVLQNLPPRTYPGETCFSETIEKWHMSATHEIMPPLGLSKDDVATDSSTALP